MFTQDALKKEGFEGFINIGSLKKDGYNIIPKEKGIYMVLYIQETSPNFLSESIGGHFKGRNPTVSISILQENWINNTQVIYIGKAGGSNSTATLNSRLKQYIEFGKGRDVGHWGGRFIWQIKESDKLLIARKTLKNEEPENIESKLINEFKQKYGKRPFANLTK